MSARCEMRDASQCHCVHWICLRWVCGGTNLVFVFLCFVFSVYAFRLFMWSWICFRSYHDHNNIINNFNCFMFSFAMAAVLISFLVVVAFFLLLLYIVHRRQFRVFILVWWCVVFFPFARTILSERFLRFIVVLDRISLSRNIINQFYLYKPYFENIRSCINCVLLAVPISNWTECVFYALHFVDLYETFCYIRLHLKV